LLTSCHLGVNVQFKEKSCDVSVTGQFPAKNKLDSSRLRRRIDVLKANGKIIIRRPSKHGDTTDLQEESVHVFPVSRWISYLILIPTSIAAAFLTAVFFSAFLALFLIGGVVLGFWIWWLRRKLRKYARSEGLDGEYVAIKETHIVETKADKVGDQ
jgi:hypothetical protein